MPAAHSESDALTATGFGCLQPTALTVTSRGFAAIPTSYSIDWTSISVADWEDRLARVRRLPVLQALPYARAMRSAKQQGARFGVIRIAGAEAGLLQLQEVGLAGRAIHLLSLDRGPAWFDGFGSLDHWHGFLDALNAEFPRRLGRRRRILPELTDTPAARDRLTAAGFLRQDGQPGYQTIWLDLDPTLDSLRAGLKQKWRNTLNKAERQGLAVEVDEAGDRIDWIVARYAADKQARDYPGPAPAFLAVLARAFAADGKCLVLTAARDGETVAAVLLLLHGRSATYQVGWSSPEGRTLGAPTLLLWNAVTWLQERGYHDFDLGGVNDRDAAGVKAFKAGLGGEEVRLVGQYR